MTPQRCFQMNLISPNYSHTVHRFGLFVSLRDSFLCDAGSGCYQGYRTSASGAISNVGCNGNLWSCAQYGSGTNGENLNYNSNNFNPANNNNRATGNAVRCVKHLQSVFTSSFFAT